jgi:hypothetical protein
VPLAASQKVRGLKKIAKTTKELKNHFSRFPLEKWFLTKKPQKPLRQKPLPASPGFDTVNCKKISPYRVSSIARCEKFQNVLPLPGHSQQLCLFWIPFDRHYFYEIGTLESFAGSENPKEEEIRISFYDIHRGYEDTI